MTALALSALLDAAAPSAQVPAPGTVRYDLSGSYPNDRRLQRYFLRGVNAYGSATATSGPQRTSLWFQPQGGGAFKQFNTTPYRTCHWDLLRWQPGKGGLLVYLETHAECYAVHTAVVFRPGIAFMPKTWTPGVPWSDQGLSQTVYSENGTPVCAGTNSWRSHVVGTTTIPTGRRAVHTQTNETQALAPIPGAPSSASCPPGRVTSFGWQENFYIGSGLTVRREDGTATGSDTGLVRSSGGSTTASREAGHPDWDSTFDSWDSFPPADAGTVTTAPTDVANASHGNTITFTYTAPSSGLHDGSVTVFVPADWTPPVTVDATGCTAATAGTVATQGQAVIVSGLTLRPNEQIVITYGATAGGDCTAGDGATAPSNGGAPIWQVQATLSRDAPFTNLSSSAAITVDPPDASREPPA